MKARAMQAEPKPFTKAQRWERAWYTGRQRKRKKWECD